MGEHVTTESGTGCVHTAPGHGQEDFVVGQKYGLEVANPVGGNGVYLPDTPLFAGQHVFKANDSVVEALQAAGALLVHKAYKHSYPHCWRHKTPIIFRATPQWFVSMDQAGLENLRRSVPATPVQAPVADSVTARLAGMGVVAETESAQLDLDAVLRRRRAG